MKKITTPLPLYETNDLTFAGAIPTQIFRKFPFFRCLLCNMAIVIFVAQVQGQVPPGCPPNTQPVKFTVSSVQYTVSNTNCTNSPSTIWDSYFGTPANPNPNAVRVDGGVDDGHFNCHAFAWANRKDVWIPSTSLGSDPNIGPQIYYNSNYYTSTSASDAEIALYGNPNSPYHSAIRLTNSNSSNTFARQYLSQYPQYAGWWISKWDGGPLAIHQLYNYPSYVSSLPITYYKKLAESGTNYIQYRSSDYSIAGPKVVCSAGTQFKLSNNTGTDIINTFPPGFTVSWTASSTSITFSPNASTYPVTVSSSASGPGEWIQAQIHFPDGTTGSVTRDTLWSGPPAYISSISKSQFTPGGTGYIAITVNQTNTELYAWPFNSADIFPPTNLISHVDSHGASSYNWTCSGLTYTQNPVVVGCRYTQGGFSSTGGATMTIHASNACGSTSQYQVLTVTTGGFMYALSPNPASNQVTVTITDNNSVQNTSGSQDPSAASAFGTPTSVPITYSITIADLFGVVYYNSKQTGNTITIPVNNFKRGNYVIEVSDGKTVSSKPLLITH